MISIQTNQKSDIVKTGWIEELVCDFIAGCDGYHGPSRKAIPDHIRKEHLHMYKDGWLGYSI